MTDKALREAIENSIGQLEAQVEEMNARFQATKAEHEATMRRAGRKRPVSRVLSCPA